MMHPMLEAIFGAFDQASVRWCVLWGETRLADPTGDVDLLVSPAEIGRVKLLLKEHQFVQVCTKKHRGARSFFVRYHAPTERWIMLDIITELAYGPYLNLRTGATAGCLARRQCHGKLSLLAPDDAFWTLLLRCLLDKRDFRQHHAARLLELVGAARMDSPLASRAASACPAGWSPARLVESVRCGEWSQLVRFAPGLVEGWRRSDPIGTWWRPLINRILWVPERALNVLQHQGVSIALLGPDGAGKSTLSAKIQRSFPVPVRCIYMGLWQREPALSRPKLPMRLPGMHTISRLFKVWARYLMAQYHQTSGRVVIFDRYVFDAQPPKRQSVGLRLWIYLWLLAHACPSPDLVLVLDAPGEVLYARKGEHTPDILEAQRRKLLGLRHYIPQVQVVDDTRAESTVYADVVGRVWSQYCAHRNKS